MDNQQERQSLTANEKRSKALKKYWENKKDRTSPFKGLNYEERYGKEKAEKVKDVLSKQKIGNNNPSKREDVRLKISATAKENFKNGNRQLPNNNPHGGFKSDINHYVRSNWEANFARILNYENIHYQYEKPIIINSDNTEQTYFVDFYLTDFNIYIELKGEIFSDEKYKIFKNQYPNYKSIIIRKAEWKELAKIYSTIILNWEGRKYKNFESSETTCLTFINKLINEDIVRNY